MRITARKAAIWSGVAVTLAVVTVALAIHARHAGVTLSGVVLRQDADPRKQLPIANVKITAVEGGRRSEGGHRPEGGRRSEGGHRSEGASDVSGLFHLQLPGGGWRDQPVSLSFRHPDYQPLETTRALDGAAAGQLWIVRMNPAHELAAVPGAHEIAVKDVSVRYSEKTSSTVNVGSTAKTFAVPNAGNVPCAGHPPCSPDGKWKAAIGGITIDAGQGQQFTNARVSCIAGPCPFTRIESGVVPTPGRMIAVRVRNWSDSVTFLVEAEVTRDMPSDAIRRSYPAKNGRSMSFTLPATAEGPSIEADLGGMEIVFPLGPALQLSWAQCSLEVGANQTKLYRCELKPGYEFQ